MAYSGSACSGSSSGIGSVLFKVRLSRWRRCGWSLSMRGSDAASRRSGRRGRRGWTAAGRGGRRGCHSWTWWRCAFSRLCETRENHYAAWMMVRGQAVRATDGEKRGFYTVVQKRSRSDRRGSLTQALATRRAVPQITCSLIRRMSAHATVAVLLLPPQLCSMRCACSLGHTLAYDKTHPCLYSIVVHNFPSLCHTSIPCPAYSSSGPNFCFEQLLPVSCRIRYSMTAN